VAHPVQVFILEFVATFILVYVVFATAVDRCGAAKNAAPLTIGLAVAVGIFAVVSLDRGVVDSFQAYKLTHACSTKTTGCCNCKQGPWTGGAINPARTIGAAIAFWEMGQSGIYVAATLCGGLAAGKVYDMLYLWDVQPASVEERDE
jgi:glycerol uptake facilitator-like aquaporin